MVFKIKALWVNWSVAHRDSAPRHQHCSSLSDPLDFKNFIMQKQSGSKMEHLVIFIGNFMQEFTLILC